MCVNKVYFDTEGTPRCIHEMIQLEPEWVATRFEVERQRTEIMRLTSLGGDAAPDMLEALKFMVKIFDKPDLIFSKRYACSKAKEAINKAEGDK